LGSQHFCFVLLFLQHRQLILLLLDKLLCLLEL
jgi:hypothetical protein